MSYVRYAENQIKLKCDATSIMDCTYLRFMNDRTNDMWYYAFINGVEYVNENTALITYEIDVMQTWFIQKGSIQPCLVKREHVNNDNIVGELEPEPVSSDIYDIDTLQYTSPDGTLFSDYLYVVTTTGEPDELQVDYSDYRSMGMLNNDLLIGAQMYAFLPDPSALKPVLNRIMGGNWDEQERKEDVLDMFAFPSKFCDSRKAQNTHQLTITHPSTLHGYTPKNNRLFTYPYSYLQVSTMNGDSAIFRWEFFYEGYDSTSFPVNFEVYGNPIGGGTIHCYPYSYQNVVKSLDNAVVMDNFPKIPYAYDAYQAWVASGGQT